MSGPQHVVPSYAQPKSESSVRLYRYEPLTPGHIRLLELLPGQRNDELRCSLLNAPLDQAPRYEAISYCWGDPEPACGIECAGQHVRITTNLASGLKQFRFRYSLRILWADQICINQNDISERSAQVNKMGRIFKQAKRVLIWLGPDDEANPQAPLAMTVIEKLRSLENRDAPHSPSVNWSINDEAIPQAPLHTPPVSWSIQAAEIHNFRKRDAPQTPPVSRSIQAAQIRRLKDELPPTSSSAWRAFKNLIKLPYFSRVWILQEVTFASATITAWGAAYLRTEYLETFLRNMSVLPWAEIGLPEEEMESFCYSLGRRYFDRSASLLKLADKARGRKAKDPRDLIFALLGMVENNPNQMVADYSKSLVEVYTSAAHAMIMESPHDLDFLSEAGTQLVVEPFQQWETWPSWVPSFPVEHLSPMFSRRHRFEADAKESRNVTQSPSGRRKLCVDGVRFAKLSHVTSFEDHGESRDHRIYHRLLKAYELFREHSSVFPQNLAESALLSGLIWTWVCGSYEDIDDIQLVSGISMREDFINLFVYVTLIDLEAGLFNSLRMLQDRFKIIDQAAAYSGPLRISSNVVANAAPSDGSPRLIQGETKQRYRRRNIWLASPTDEALIDRTERTIAELDWSYDDIQAASKLFAAPLVMGGERDHFCNYFPPENLKRVFFITREGSIGLGSPATQPNDIVVILFGGKVPYILRPTDVEGEYHFIGDCYVDGIMHGEYIKKLKTEGKFAENKTRFTLV